MSGTVDLISELATVTGWLRASLLPGTHGPYRPELSADRKSELAQQRWIEQLQADYGEAKARGQYALPTTAPLGESPAPMNIEILDLLFEITEWAEPHAGVTLSRRDVDDPRPLVELIRRRLQHGDIPNPWALEDSCEDFITRGHHAMGLVEDGQLLRAICPWCKGITGSHPEGGQRTWRVRARLPENRKSIVNVDPTRVQWFVVCESGTCEPPTEEVSTWWRDRPAWYLRTDGDRLAKRLQQAQEAKAS